MKILNPRTVWTVPEQFRSIDTHALEALAGPTLLICGQFGVASNGQVRAASSERLVVAALARPDALIGVAMAALRSIAAARSGGATSFKPLAT